MNELPILTERQFQLALASRLREHEFDVRLEVTIPGGRVDILAIRGSRALLVETKVQNPFPGIAQLYRYMPYTGGSPVLAIPTWLASEQLRYSCACNDVGCWEIPVHEVAA